MNAECMQTSSTNVENGFEKKKKLHPIKHAFTNILS